MSKSQLQSNNTRLASLIDELKGKATGGGGSIETCTVTIDAKYAIPGNESGNIWYTNSEMSIQQDTWSHNSVFTVVKGTIILADNMSGTGLDKSVLTSAQTLYGIAVLEDLVIRVLG